MSSFVALNDAYAVVSVTQAVRRLGILPLLSEGAVTGRQLATRCGLDPSVTRALLDALVTLDLAEVDQAGRYRARPLAQMLDIFQFWTGLEDRLRSGPPAARCDRPDGAAAIYPRVVETMAEATRDEAARAAERLVELGQGMRVLEVGAGAATWSLALCRRDPRTRVTALDLPQVIEQTRAVVDAAGRAEAYQLIGADVFEHALPPGRYDLALVPNVCHLFGPARILELLSRLKRAIRPGGALALIDVMPGDTPRRSSALHALSLLLRTAEGRVHRVEDYRRWLRGAGYEPPAHTPIPGAHGIELLTARRPRADGDSG